MSESAKKFEALGAFALIEAPRIVAELDAAGIAYEYQFDDAEIKRMYISDVAIRGGTGGLGQKIRLFVAEENLAAANAILARLYPV